MADFAPLRPDVIGQLGDLQDNAVLGTDFPDIPYPCATPLDALQRFELGEDWLRDVCWYNGQRLLARA